MCGITAILNKYQQVNPLQLKKMTDSISHRGPDDFGYFIDGRIGLGHRRLSILDLSTSGHQPMVSYDKRFVIVFNGEIYNYLEIKDTLIAKGYIFKSTSDTEVLLNSYIEWGHLCLNRFNGMWSFIIYDMINKIAFISRDRFGVKPLYIHKSNESLIIGSEIKTILSSYAYQITFNDKKIAEYLYYGKLDNDQETFYNGIHSVSPGSYMIIDRELNIKEQRYWSITADIDIVSDEKTLQEQYFALFEDSVKLRMRSDVPVGVCLSGGLDSTSIICSMNRLQQKLNISERIEAFSYTDKDYCETQYIDDTMHAVNATLNTLSSNPTELWNNIDNVIAYHDEPVHSLTAIVGFILFKMIKSKGIKVILNGQGADESLGGYSSYFEDYWLTLLSKQKYYEFYNEIDNYCCAFRQNIRHKIKTTLIRYIKQKLHASATYKHLSNKKLARELRGDRYINQQLSYYMCHDYDSSSSNNLSDALMKSVQESPLPLYLRVEDRNSMASSTEARLPFMDYRLINAAFSLPDNLKLRGSYNKFILRKAMTGKIPTSVSERLDKMGFPTSYSSWTETVLKNPIIEILHQISSRTCELFHVQNISKDLDDDTLSEDGKRKLWRLLQIESMFKNSQRYANSSNI